MKLAELKNKNIRLVNYEHLLAIWDDGDSDEKHDLGSKRNLVSAVKVSKEIEMDINSLTSKSLITLQPHSTKQNSEGSFRIVSQCSNRVLCFNRNRNECEFVDRDTAELQRDYRTIWEIRYDKLSGAFVISQMEDNQPRYLSLSARSRKLVLLSETLKSTSANWSLLPSVREFRCPYEKCKDSSTLFDEDELCKHCETVHCRENSLQVCPICTHFGISGIAGTLVGTSTWGYSTHLHTHHGPRSRIHEKEKHRKPEPIALFALVVVQNKNGDYLLVEECCQQGWWLPGGKVEPGESFQEAAIRETLEETGVKIKLTGILRYEYTPKSHRQRVIFLGEPVSDKEKVRTTPTFDSVQAVWTNYSAFTKDVQSKQKELRGLEPYIWFSYVQHGGPIHSLDLLATESYVGDIEKYFHN